MSEVYQFFSLPFFFFINRDTKTKKKKLLIRESSAWFFFNRFLYFLRTIASLRRVGLHPRGEERHLQDHRRCDAHGWYEVQAKGSRGAGRGRWHRGIYSLFWFKLIFPPPEIRNRDANVVSGRLQEGERVAKLLGCDCADLYKNLLKPRIKVGNEFVTQGRNKDQVAYSVGAMSKAMFDRLFKWLVKKCNETLDTKQKRQHFIGVLDIAGFEIFDVSFLLHHSSFSSNEISDKDELSIIVLAILSKIYLFFFLLSSKSPTRR